MVLASFLPIIIGWEWNFSWRRSLFDNEIGMAAEFLEELAQVTIHQDRPDLWVWKADPSGFGQASRRKTRF